MDRPTLQGAALWALPPTPEQLYLDREDVDVLERALTTLSPREEKVLRLRFGLSDGHEHTLEEIGEDFAVTRDRIRQIEAVALHKLRRPSRWLPKSVKGNSHFSP